MASALSLERDRCDGLVALQSAMSKHHAEQMEELQMAISLMREELMGVEGHALMTSSINEARERQKLDALRLSQQAASREAARSRQEAIDLRAELEQLRTALEVEGKFPTGVTAAGRRLPSVAEVRESLLTPPSAALSTALGSSPGSSFSQPGSSSSQNLERTVWTQQVQEVLTQSAERRSGRRLTRQSPSKRPAGAVVGAWATPPREASSWASRHGAAADDEDVADEGTPHVPTTTPHVPTTTPHVPDSPLLRLLSDAARALRNTSMATPPATCTRSFAALATGMVSPTRAGPTIQPPSSRHPAAQHGAGEAATTAGGVPRAGTPEVQALLRYSMLEAAEQWHQTEVLRGQVFELTGQIVDLTRQLEVAQRHAKASAARTAALEASAHENAAMVQAAAEAALRTAREQEAVRAAESEARVARARRQSRDTQQSCETATEEANRARAAAAAEVARAHDELAVAKEVAEAAASSARREAAAQATLATKAIEEARRIEQEARRTEQRAEASVAAAREEVSSTKEEAAAELARLRRVMAAADELRKEEAERQAFEADERVREAREAANQARQVAADAERRAREEAERTKAALHEAQSAMSVAVARHASAGQVAHEIAMRAEVAMDRGDH